MVLMCDVICLQDVPEELGTLNGTTGSISSQHICQREITVCIPADEIQQMDEVVGVLYCSPFGRSTIDRKKICRMHSTARMPVITAPLNLSLFCISRVLKWKRQCKQGDSPLPT